MLLRASSEGTARFRDASAAAPGHFRPGMAGVASSLGIGLPRPGRRGDRRALMPLGARALQLGLNVVDTAINTATAQRARRGRGRRRAASPHGIVLCTKGGYLAFDGARPHDARAYVERRSSSGILTADEIVAGCHSMAPAISPIKSTVARTWSRVHRRLLPHNPETSSARCRAPSSPPRLAFEALERLQRIAWCTGGHLSLA